MTLNPFLEPNDQDQHTRFYALPICKLCNDTVEDQDDELCESCMPIQDDEGG